MNGILSVLAAFERYATFVGRSGRPEYWWYTLFLLVVSTFTTVVDIAFSTVAFRVLVGLAFLLPSISVTVRRLHDTGRSGRWALVALIPIAGFLALLVWETQRGDADENKYGPPPRHPAAVG